MPRQLASGQPVDQRVVAMASHLYEVEALTARGSGKTPEFNARKAIAIAVAFFEVIEGEDWNRSAAERFAELA